MCLTAYPGVSSSIPAWHHTFIEIDLEIMSMVILLPSTDSRRVVASYKPNNVQEVMVNCPGKSVVRCTDHPNMTIAVGWDVKNQTKLNTHGN